MFNWGAFLTYVFISAITPGPNTLLALSLGSRMGLRKSLPFHLGILVGLGLTMSASAVFCSALAGILSRIRLPMLVLGAGYMLYLAWKIFRSDVLGEEERQGGFLSGVTLQFVNPKTYLYGIFSMELYILPHYSGQPLALLGFALLLAIFGVACTCCWSAFGSLFQVLFTRYGKITNAVLALAMAWCAVALFL